MLNTNIGQALALPYTCAVSGQVKGSYENDKKMVEDIHRPKKILEWNITPQKLQKKKITKKITFGKSGVLKNLLVTPL